MPVVISFDIKHAPQKNSIAFGVFFERLGWENLGGSSYRYPRLSSDPMPEDWFNHVVPALMLLRCFLLKNQAITLTKFTLDAHSSTGHHPETGYGAPPMESSSVHFAPTKRPQFGDKKLREWLANLNYPYDGKPREPKAARQGVDLP